MLNPPYFSAGGLFVLFRIISAKKLLIILVSDGYPGRPPASGWTTPPLLYKPRGGFFELHPSPAPIGTSKMNRGEVWCMAAVLSPPCRSWQLSSGKILRDLRQMLQPPHGQVFRCACPCSIESCFSDMDERHFLRVFP